MALFYLNLRVFKFILHSCLFLTVHALQEVPSSWHWLGLNSPSLSLSLSGYN